MKKNSKNREQFFEILSHMDAIDDFVNLISSMCASIDIKYGKKKELNAPLNASALLKDLIDKYNSVTKIHYLNSFRGVIKSPKKRDRKTYINRFKKKLIEVIDFRYSCGHSVATLNKEEIVDAINTFFELLND